MHPRVSVNPQCSGTTTLEDELRFWADNGIERVGVSAAKLAAAGWDHGIDLVRDQGLDVRYLVYGVYTPVTDDPGWQKERQILVPAVEACAELGSDCLYFCSGPLDHLRWEEGVERLAWQLDPVIDAARHNGVHLALENSLSVRSEISFLHTVRDTIAAAATMDIGVCVDLYACWAEPGLRTTLRDNVGRVHLVQCSDFIVGTLVQPNRWVPGDGDLPLTRLLDDVLDAGYTGTIDLELLGPAIETEGPAAAVNRALVWLTSHLESAPEAT